MVHTETRLAYGKIYTQGMEFKLLDLKPFTPADVPLREYCLAFQVLDVYGNLRTLLVSKQNFAIIPDEPESVEVRYEIKEDTDIDSLSSPMTMTLSVPFES